MSVLYGDKLIIENSKEIENIGAVFLFKNQEKHYLDYFLLLLGYWEYMPSEKHLKEMKVFIKKYYKKEIYLTIFNMAVEKNKFYINKIKNLFNNYKKQK